MEDVPIMFAKPLISSAGQKLKFGPNVELTEKERHKRTIDLKKLDRGMCSPSEVIRTFKVKDNF